MAVDVEPGLIDFYEDENTFCQIHPFLLEQGFWLSSMNVLGSARMRPETLARLQSSDRSGDWFEQRIRHTPGWIEARYLRRPDHIQTPEEHGLLWVFALLDHQYGFALDLAMNYQALFGKDTIFQIMQSIPIDMMKPPLQKSMSGFKQWVPTPVKHWIKQKLGIQK
jgi:hypothetical protein